jgi:hypothetical protein
MTVHLDEEFSHHGGECDFGWFALLAQVVVELPQDIFFLPRQPHGAHVEGMSHDSAASADMPLALPRAALPRPRRKPRKSGGLPAVESAQFGHVRQDGHRSDKANARQLIQKSGLLLVGRGFRHRFGQLFLHPVQLALQMFAQTGLFPENERIGGVLAMLAGADQLLLELSAPIDQRADSRRRIVSFGRGQGLMSLAVSSQHGAIDLVAFGAGSAGQGEMAHMAWVQNADRQIRLVKGADDGTLITAGGFANDLNLRTRLEEFQEFIMAPGRVGQGVLTALEMKLERSLGDIQAGIDGFDLIRHTGNNCLAHSCKYERDANAAAPSTVRVTDNRRLRLRLPGEHVQKRVPENDEHACAAILWPAGQRMGLIFQSTFQSDKKDQKATYKRIEERGARESAIVLVKLL